MKKIYELLLKLPNWCGICIIMIYSILTAEYTSTLTHYLIGQLEGITKIVTVISYFGYITSILFSFVIWIVYSYMFYLAAITLGGKGDFIQLLMRSTFTFVVPAICILVAIIILDDVVVSNEQELIVNVSVRKTNLLVDLAFVPYYLLNTLVVRYAFDLRWWRAFVSVFGPVIALVGLSKLFQLF